MTPDTRSSILKEINDVVSRILRLPNLMMDPSTSAYDVPGWDSLTHIQIIIEIEQIYGIRFTSTEVAQLENAGSLVDLVLKHT